MVGSQRWGWAVITAAGGAIGIDLGAFWLSFTALADLARRSVIAGSQAWVWPLLVDGLIVVATIAVVALDGRPGAWYPWGLLVAGALVSVTANAMHAVVAAEAAVPGLLASIIASVPPLVLLASTHLTVVLIRSTHPTPASEPPDSEAVSAPPGPDRLLEVDVSEERQTPDEPVLTSATVADLPAPSLTLTAPEPAEQDPAAPHQTASDDGASLAGPYADSGAPVSDRKAEATQLWEAGWSNKAIAAHLNVHPSTIGRWRTRQTTTASPHQNEAAEKESTS
ncbi:DUF2637 domain-containing protein [Kocuria sp. JC486]|uniref:DUF2637 domain-containing protein n=1 Tax=Kocuria sp. JC486 TaxID=1970736 RepID=UPI0014216C22|nr:DUF2637 domain-containing protein [Kocuria sp. JC486]NHU86422.1 DUF2637 domain-containing protein [Kocuria sp. JC486]